MHTTETLVLNWHLTEACNYRCQYCYSVWDKPCRSRELVRNPLQTTQLLEQLYQFFRPDNLANPLRQQLRWSKLRLNLAGGEPLLHADRMHAVIQQARQLGFEVSLITNGSYLDRPLLEQLAAELVWLGISIDSAQEQTSRAIGRVDRHGRLLDLASLTRDLQHARQLNPQLRLKLNTVVNQLNCREDLGPLLQQLAPHKWKVLRMLPVINQQLAVSDQQFHDFVARHASFAGILCAEDNQEMRESYLMVDPLGRFFQNDQPEGAASYSYSAPIHEAGAAAAFSSLRFLAGRFAARYPQYLPQPAI